MGNPLASILLLEGLSDRVEWKHTEVLLYLLCYQEVIAQSFSGADSSQEEDEDQIQEPPASQQQHTTELLLGVITGPRLTERATVGAVLCFVLSNQSGKSCSFKNTTKLSVGTAKVNLGLETGKYLGRETPGHLKTVPVQTCAFKKKHNSLIMHQVLFFVLTVPSSVCVLSLLYWSVAFHCNVLVFLIKQWSSCVFAVVRGEDSCQSSHWDVVFRPLKIGAHVEACHYPYTHTHTPQKCSRPIVQHKCSCDNWTQVSTHCTCASLTILWQQSEKPVAAGKNTPNTVKNVSPGL